MKHLSVKKGHSPRIAGEPSPALDALPRPERVALLPRRMAHLKPRLLVETGQRVALGAPLIEDRRHPDVRVMSPGGGTVEAIDFGPRRVIARIVIRLDEEEERVARDPMGAADLGRMPRGEVVRRLVAAGLWPFLKALPFRDYPPEESVPPAIHVSLGSLEPFQPAPEVYLDGKGELFAFGLAVLEKLAGDPAAVFVSTARARAARLAPLVGGALTHAYAGAYPAHDPGVLVYRTRRSSSENRSWYIDGQDLLLVAECLSSGVYPTHRVMVAAGPAAPVRRHLLARLGAPLASLAPGASAGGDVRFVVGGIFTGYTGRPDGYMGLFQTSLTLLPEGDRREFLALINPGLRKLSYSRAFLSSFHPALLDTDCNLHGGLRACIACGHCNDVCPVDILPQLTYKAVLADEFEEYLALGLLDCVECGLCSYVCPSKIEVAAALRDARAAYYRQRE